MLQNGIDVVGKMQQTGYGSKPTCRAWLGRSCTQMTNRIVLQDTDDSIRSPIRALNGAF